MRRGLEWLFDTFPRATDWLAGVVVVSVLSFGAAVIGTLGSVWSPELRASPPVSWFDRPRTDLKTRGADAGTAAPESAAPQPEPRVPSEIVDGGVAAPSPQLKAEEEHLLSAIGPVAGFYVALCAWVVLFFLHRAAVAVQRDRSTARLERLVLRAPHRAVFEHAGAMAGLAWRGVQAVRSGPKEKAAAIAREHLNGVLKAIADFAHGFGGARGAYGANVMLAFDVARLQQDEAVAKKLRFFDLTKERPDQLSAVLCMYPELTVNGGPDGKRSVPIICLPVPHQSTDQAGRWLAVPGAPKTFLEGHPGIHVNIDDFVRDCRTFGNFKPSVIDEVDRYFKTDAAGVGSFASFRVGDLGVLNIDCDAPDLLGGDDEFTPTFVALLYPTLVLLADLVEPIYDDYTSPGAEGASDDRPQGPPDPPVPQPG